MRLSAVAAVAAVAVAMSASARASTVLDFENIQPYPPGHFDTQVFGYYDGGKSSNGSSGPNYGVLFNANTYVLCLNTVGTSCSNTSRGAPGPSDEAGIVFEENAFFDDTGVMNVPA